MSAGTWFLRRVEHGTQHAKCLSALGSLVPGDWVTELPLYMGVDCRKSESQTGFDLIVAGALSGVFIWNLR